jgi:hypothetical protein
MRYTLVVMQINGDITERQRRTDAEIQRNEALRRVTLGLRLMLDEYVPAAIHDVVEFRVPLDDAGSFELEWRQPDHVSALGTYYMGGRPRITCLLYSGYDRIRDAAAIDATDNLLTGWCKDIQRPRGTGIRNVRDRPLLVCVPWPPSTEGIERKRMTVYPACLAVAFFERAAAATVIGPSCN